MKKRTLVALLVPAVAVIASAKGADKEAKLTIGLSLDTLKEERWQRDRDLFKAECEKRGARVLVQASRG